MSTERAGARPRLTFFCELAAEPLAALFAADSEPAGSAVIADLVALGAGVSLGILDLSPERAAVVRRLNQAGVPVRAWLLLPESDGYWFNANNAEPAAARYEAFKRWTAEHELRWEGVGLDIEPDMREIEALRVNWRGVALALRRRLFSGDLLRRAEGDYAALVARIRADGYHVDSYVLPFIVDERLAGSRILRRLLGLVDVPANREIPMLYSSFVRPAGPGFLWSYAPGAPSVGVGSTGGGVKVAGANKVPPLSWEELTRDLLLAFAWTDDIHVFSLEGSVERGYLDRLVAFDWHQPVEMPSGLARRVELGRRALRAGLWAGSNPAAIAFGLVALYRVWRALHAGCCRGRREDDGWCC